jgi:outer membrane receptor protein involved in Fe transport
MRIRNTAATLVFIASTLFPSSISAQTAQEAQAQNSGHSETADPFRVTVQVTATRFGEPIQQVPGAISVVTGDEIRARGAKDLRTALALLGGVSVAPGGDAGPAATVPGLLGVREVDDLLLLIDGIPAGGAFIPQVEAISLNNVERIEVMRGAAPVYFGTTAFAGTINIIHYAAGKSERTESVRYGSRNSWGVSFAEVLSDGRLQHSLSGEISDDTLSGQRTGFRRGQATYRLATNLGHGKLTADIDLLALRQKPNSPLPIDEATGQFSTLLPVDFNQNPANARLDTDRYKFVLGYALPLSFGRWGTSIAYSNAQTGSVRGFLDIGDTPQPWTPKTNADLESFKQSLSLQEMFLDSNLTTALSPHLDLTTGVNLLVGRADADSLRYGLRLLLDGASQAPDIETVSPKGTVSLDDHRRFLGVYAQSRYHVSSNASLLAGLRWNITHETRDETRINSRGVATTAPASQDVDRLSGSLGAQWKALQFSKGPIDSLTLHGSFGNTFQPAQIDFGPDPEAKPEGGGLLKPETQRSFVTGIKADAMDGRAELDVDAFFVDFYNQPVEASSGGVAVLRSIGKQRYKGIDIEGALHLAEFWTLRANLTASNAQYLDYVTNINGTLTQLAGNRQVLTPAFRGSAGLIYAPKRGLGGSFTASWTGRHWLNSLNTFSAPAYAVIDASLSYRFERFTLSVSGNNLGNRRDAVQLSELGEGQFYTMNARTVDAMLSWHFR